MILVGLDSGERGREGNVHSAADTTTATTAQLHLFLAGLDATDVNFCPGNI